jgi:hypothetical protein
MSSAETRSNRRRAVTYPAYIDVGDGSPARQCTLCDASQHGALLEVAEPHTLPNQFTLALSVDGAARRKCRVAWRTKAQIGVEFLKDDKKNLRPIVPPLVTIAATEPETDETADTIDIETFAAR